MTNPSSATHSGHGPAKPGRFGPQALLSAVQAAVSRALDPDGATWFAKARQQIEADRALLVRLFPAVSRKCGREHLWPVGPDLIGWTVDDAVRALLLVGASIEEVTTVYTYGDPAEKRAVLRALPLLDVGDTAVPLVLDALGSNDNKLIAAAVGPYAAKHLPAQSWRHAVFICITRAVPLAWVADLKRRTDAELVDMVRAYAHRRLAAGRSVPPDVLRLVPDLHTDPSPREAADAPAPGEPIEPAGSRSEQGDGGSPSTARSSRS